MTPYAQMIDHYKVLGCDKNASEDEIKRAYRKASLLAHPDKVGGSEEKCVVDAGWSYDSHPERRAGSRR